MIFGQNGNDVIQGDGSIDLRPGRPASVRQHGAVGAVEHAVREPRRRLPRRPPARRSGSNAVGRQPRHRRQRLHRGRRRQRHRLRQPGPGRHHRRQLEPVRPDDARAARRTARTCSSAARAPRSPTTTRATRSANGHANDSDAIVGNNGLIYDLVGTNGVRRGNFLQLQLRPAAAGATAHVIPRAVTLLDYTPGGPDYAGQAGPLVDRRHRRRRRDPRRGRRRLHLRRRRQRRPLRRRPERHDRRRLRQRLDLGRQRRRRHPRRRRPHPREPRRHRRAAERDRRADRPDRRRSTPSSRSRAAAQT